jgi:diguanylate cyclase (GGDEF)-like protein
MTTPLDSPDGHLPEKIGPYRLLDKLGEGASSVVHRAFHEEDPTQPVAIKLTKGLWTEADIETRVRFEHEADLLSRLSHENIVQLRRFGVHGGVLYLVMELAAGRALSKLIVGREILKILDIVSVLRQVAQALAHAHAKGILHRDIKPSNVVVALANGAPRVKVLDFGLSRLQGRAVGAQTVGTFLYMSPEQLGILPQAVDERSDLYSLGMLAVELLNGRHPFAGQGVRELIHSHAAVVPELPKETPEGLQNILHALLKKDPAERYASAAQLVKDLDVLEERLRRGEGGAFPLRLGDVGGKLGLPRFLGRQPDLDALRDQYEKAAGGGRAWALLSGPSGVGKSRLIGEAALGWSRGPVLWARGRDYGQATAHGLVAELFRGIAPEALSPRAVERLRSAVGERGEDLLRLAPELRALLTGPMDTTDLAPERRQQRFLNVALDALQALGDRDSPLVLVVDDVQWADEGSLLVLRRFLESADTRSVLGVFVHRTDAGLGGESVPAFLEALGGLAETRRLVLDPLTEGQIAAIVDSMLGAPNPEIASAVAAQAKGNPLYAVEFLRSLVESGAIQGGGKEGWRVVDPALLHEGQSGGVTGKIAGRVDLLPEEEQAIVKIAAVVGNPFEFDVLSSAVARRLGLPPEEAARRVAHALELAGQARLVEPLPGGGKYVFSHNKIREAIDAHLGEQQRVDLHRCVGLALEAAGNPDGRMFDLAHHFTRAGDTERSVAYSLRAGEISLNRYAQREALAFFGTAQQGLESMMPGPRRTATERQLLETRGEAERMIGRYEEALRAYERAAALSEDKKDRIRIKTKIGRALFSKGEHRRAAGVLEEALGLAGDSIPRSRFVLFLGLCREFVVQLWHTLRPPRARSGAGEGVKELGRLYDELSHVYYFTDKLKALFIHLRHLNFAERWRIPEILSQAYCNHGPGAATVGLMNRGVDYILKGLAYREQAGDRWGVAQARSYLAAVLFLSTQSREAIRQARLAEPEFEELGDRWELITLYLTLASLYAQVGEWAQSEAYIERIRRLATVSKNWSGLALAIRGSAELLGRIPPDRVIEQAQAVLPLCREAGDHTAVVGLLYACGRSALAAGRPEQAEAFYREALDLKARHPIARGGHLGLPFRMTDALVARARRAHDAEEKRRVLKEAVRWERAGRRETTISSIKLLYTLSLSTRANLLNALGNHRAAEALWERCLMKGLGRLSPNEMAIIFGDFGEALLPRDRERAVNLLRDALRIHEKIGNRLEMERIARLLPELAVAPSTESIRPSRSATGSSSSSHGRLVEAERLETLVEVSVQLTGILDLDQLFHRVVDDAARIFGAERAILFLNENSPEGFRQKAVSQTEGAKSEARPVPGAILVEVLKKGITLLSDDAQIDAAINVSESVVSSGVHSFMAVPLKSKERILGGLYLDNRLLKGLFSKHDLKILAAFASQVSVALENARLFAGQTRAQEELRQLYDASRELMGVLDRRLIYASFLSRSRSLTGASAAAMVFCEEGGPAVRLQNGFAPAHIKEIEGLAAGCQVRDPMEKILNDGTAVYLVPLWVGDALEGGVVVRDVRDGRSRDLLAHLATQCSLALHNARLYEMAITDEMTQVYQRRYYEMVTKNLVDRRTRFALILMDMNDFKAINDSLGHGVGDAVLKAVGRALRQTLRVSDIAARIGGDEFAVVLTGESEEATRQVMEKLREAVAAIRVDVPGGAPPRVWASFGYAMSEEGDWAAVSAAADRRLYEDKRRSKKPPG